MRTKQGREAVVLTFLFWKAAHTKLLNASGEEIAITDFKPGDAVSVTLKDSFTEETPFYYPIVYEIKLIDQ